MAIFIPLVTKFDNKGLNNATRALANFQNFAVDVGRIAAGAIAAVGVASAREAATFESTFAKIQGLVGVTTDEIVELEEAARRLGPSFGVSANEAGEALFFITSAGLRGAQATEVLEAALKGTAIGLGETKTIADLATSAMNAFGAENLSGTKAVDILAEAVRLGKAEPADFADALGMVLPIAAEMGISFDQVAGSVAAMSKTGSDARIATTQLRQVMATILSPTVGANEALADMGLSAQGLRDQIREEGLLSTLQTLKERFGDNEEAASSVFGNIRALMGVLDLMGANAEDNAEIMRLMADDVGILDEALAIVQDTAANKFAVAMETARDSLLEIGLSILEMVTPHLDAFTKWMEKNGPTIEQGFIKIFDAVNKFLTSEVLADIIQQFKDMWPEIKEVVFQLGELVGVLAPLLLDAVNDILPLFDDLATIMRDLAFFTDEVLGLFEDLGIETPFIEQFLGRIFNPMNRLKIATEGLRDALRAVRTLFQQMKSFGLDVLEGGALPGQFGGRRAGGGPVASGKGYLVGEMGPELFIPSSGGNIVPNDRVSGGAKISITVNAGMGANGAQIGEQIVTAIKRYERTSGPVFASA